MLAGENRSKETLRTYTAGAERFLLWMEANRRNCHPRSITRDDIRRFLAAELEHNSTERARFSALQRFFNWAVEEEEIARSPLEKIKAPSVPEKPTRIPTEETVKVLLRVTEGREFWSVGTGQSCGSCSSVACVGPRWRATGSPTSTSTAPNALYQMIERRCREAGIRMHPHRLRHFFAHSWKSAGSSEEDLQRLGRWRDPKTLKRYGAANADRRAREAHRRISPGDRL